MGYYDKPEKTSFAIALILPGSQKESVLGFHDGLKAGLNALELCAVTLEKRGIGDDKEYIRSLSLKQRLDDHLLLHGKLKELIPGWNGKIAIVGQGDGGRIGASFASTVKNISALILIAAGGSWPPLEEALYSFRREMAGEGYSPQYIQSFLVQAREEFAQALKNPKPEHKAFGYTYKYWESLLNTHLLHDLSSLKCPLYLAHGDRDDRVPIESVDAMAKHLKEQITYQRIENAGREIMQDPEVYEEAFSWLKRQ